MSLDIAAGLAPGARTALVVELKECHILGGKSSFSPETGHGMP
jgi:hypothetical protein